MNTKNIRSNDQDTGPWDDWVLAQLREWDPEWGQTCAGMATNPWRSQILPRRLVELVGVAVNAACTNLNADGTRRHIRRALDAGASRDEVLMVLKMAALLAIHVCSLGAPILLEEAKAAGVTAKSKPTASPACDNMKAMGQWNAAWDPFFALDPEWTNEFMATGLGIYKTSVLPQKEVELLSIAFDVAYTHMYAPGTRRHIRNALAAGATLEEIMEVFKLCVVQGVQALNLAVPILADELISDSTRAPSGAPGKTYSHD